MNYTIIDFETAGSKRATACSIGMIKIEEGKVVSKYHRLIKPECFPNFNYMNMMIHGITPEDVQLEPEFNDLWEEIKPWIENQLLVAHNAAFDISVLTRSLELYKLEVPIFKYLCTYKLSKSAIENLPYYSLDYLANHFGIKFKHHDALEDCLATEKLLSFLLDLVDEKILESHVKESFVFGKRVQSRNRPANIDAEDGLKDENSIFYEKEVVFTGTLLSMTRNSAQQLVANIGGIVGKSLNFRTSFLVVGQQDYKVVAKIGKSATQMKAERLSSNGQVIEILSEQEFLDSFE